MDNLKLSIEEEVKLEPKQQQVTITNSQKELILKLHTQYKIPLFTTIYIVIQKNCQDSEQANQLYENITPNDHNFIKFNNSDDCAICLKEEKEHQALDQNYSNLILIAEEILNQNNPKITCSICFELQPQENIVEFNQNLHNICQLCFKINIQTQISFGHVQDLKCPHCNEVLSEIIIFKYAEEVRQKYIKFKNNVSIATSTDRMWCPNNLCQKIVIFKSSNNIEKCQYCQLEFCKKCRQKSHPNINCEENLKQFIGVPQNTERMAQCPRCKFLVEKVAGCSQMTCTYCKCQWCWGCRKEITFLHPLYCPHFMPCYDEKKLWTKFVLIFWYFYLIFCLFLFGLFFGQIMLFQCLHQANFYMNQKLCLQIVLNILVFILGTILLPLTTALYLISIIPICIAGFVYDWYDGQKLKNQRLDSNFQQIEV